MRCGARWRPRSLLGAGLNNHDRSVRVDVLPTGEVLYVEGKGHFNWLSLSGIILHVGAAATPSL